MKFYILLYFLLSATAKKRDGNNPRNDDIKRNDANIPKESRENRPWLDKTHENLTAEVRSSVSLHCRIKNYRNYVVNWMKNYSELLTENFDTISNDARFNVEYENYTNDWILKIKNVTQNDSGNYKCVVKSTPNSYYYVNLTVLKPKISIDGNSILFLKEGSSLILKCRISDFIQIPKDVYWYHNQRDIITQINKIEIRDETNNKGKSVELIIKLHNRNVTTIDSGSYTCRSSHFTSNSSVLVHVFKAFDSNQSARIYDYNQTIFIGSPPSFDSQTPKSVTCYVGDTAKLHCIVNNLKYHMVIWKRRKDHSLLTVVDNKVISDERFGITNVDNDWILEIKNVNLNDRGYYDCQIPSNSTIMHPVKLITLD